MDIWVKWWVDNIFGNCFKINDWNDYIEMFRVEVNYRKNEFLIRVIIVNEYYW